MIFFFFFQAEDGIRDKLVTGVQTCALPISNAVYANGAPAGVNQGEWWRLITAAFLHYGPFHLAINMYSLYFAGSILEQVIGRWRFALLYLVSGISGAAGALFWSPNA